MNQKLTSLLCCVAMLIPAYTQAWGESSQRELSFSPTSFISKAECGYRNNMEKGVLENSYISMDLRQGYGIMKTEPLSASSKNSGTSDRRNKQENMCDITFDYIGDDNYSISGMGYAEENDASWSIIRAENGSLQNFKFTTGNYCIVAIFRSATEGEPTKIVIKENMVISDNTVIEFDKSSATELIEFQGILPDGEIIKGPVYDTNFNIIEQGNIFTSHSFTNSFTGNFSNKLFHSRYGLLFYVDGIPGYLKNDDTITDMERGGFFLINPGVSDNFICVQDQLQVSADGINILSLQSASDGVKAQIVKNNPSDYVYQSYDELFTTEGFCVDEPIKTHTLDGGYYVLYKGKLLSVLGAPSKTFAATTGYKACISNNNCDVRIVPFVNPQLETEKKLTGGVLKYDMFQLNPPLQGSRNDKAYSLITPILQSSYYGSTLFYDKDGVNTILTLNGAEAFSFNNENSRQRAGDNCPMIYFNSYVTSDIFDCYTAYWGRVGESPSQPKSHPQDVSVRYGDTTWSGNPSLESGWYDLWADFNDGLSSYKGDLHMSITQQNQIIVDGIPSEAKMDASWDFSKEDPIPPVLTMIQFRDKDQAVTDRFEKGEDGILTFSAADLKRYEEIINDGDGNYLGTVSYDTFIGTPVPTVEYSPLHSNEWSSIEVCEDKDKFFMPCYGAYFYGNLKNVNRPSASGWFDLRISLTDNAGNTQTSIISPAFKIDSLSNIDSIKEDDKTIFISGDFAYISGGDEAHFSVFSMDGVLLLSGKGNTIDLRDLQPGIYVITGKTGRATLSRKITL